MPRQPFPSDPPPDTEKHFRPQPPPPASELEDGRAWNARITAGPHPHLPLHESPTPSLNYCSSPLNGILWVPGLFDPGEIEENQLLKESKDAISILKTVIMPHTPQHISPFTRAVGSSAGTALRDAQGPSNYDPVPPVYGMVSSSSRRSLHSGDTHPGLHFCGSVPSLNQFAAQHPFTWRGKAFCCATRWYVSSNAPGTKTLSRRTCRVGSKRQMDKRHASRPQSAYGVDNGALQEGTWSPQLHWRLRRLR
ncbi:hypothetical protein BR93DRAFT_486485 [Coniochaeta sp. PMI_546]|nr:hypothetical protein BR93DRAFT_486485 [Coniochaeta sp. PMI_546]